MPFCCLQNFSKFTLKKMHSGIPLVCQTVWIQIMGPNGLHRLSTDTASKEGVNLQFLEGALGPLRLGK